MDVIIKKDQPHDVRVELWRYYHDPRPFHQPQVSPLSDIASNTRLTNFSSSLSIFFSLPLNLSVIQILHDKKLALKFHYWNPLIHSNMKKQKIEKYAAAKAHTNYALVKQKTNTADILAKTAQRLVSSNVFGLSV
jgi:hypothetical protein